MADRTMTINLRARTSDMKNDIKTALKEAGSFKLNIMQGIREGFMGGTGGGGLGQIIGKLSLIGLAMEGLKASIGRLVGLFAKASPIFKGVLDIMERAVLNFLRPIADALGLWLRPMAMAILKMSVAWIKFTRSVDLGKAFKDLFGGADLGTDFFKELFTSMITGKKFDFGTWLKDNIKGYFTDTKFQMSVWITENIMKFIDDAKKFNFGEWIAGNVWSFITSTPFDLGKWILENIWNFISGNTPKPQSQPGPPASSGSNFQGPPSTWRASPADVIAVIERGNQLNLRGRGVII